MKKLLASATAAVAVTSSLMLAPTANAAQGGNDTRGGFANAHSWVKVSRDELQGKSADFVINNTFSLRGVPGGVSNLIVRVSNERQRNPKANGYWAENYYNAKPWPTARSGTW